MLHQALVAIDQHRSSTISLFYFSSTTYLSGVTRNPGQEESSTSKTDLVSAGQAAGLAAVGVTSAEPFPAVHGEMQSRLDDGTAGRPRFTYKDPKTATDVRKSFPWARSLVVGAVSYLPEAGTPGPSAPNSGRIARFATADHYETLRRGLTVIAEILIGRGYRAQVLVDDDRLVDRAAAVRGGIAWWGKNTMALAPGYGPWMLLGSVATEADLDADEPMKRDCGTCTACIPACPTGALDAVGRLDATKCISYWAQTRGTIPDDVREHWGDRIYGCDDCLEACPPGSRLLESSSTVDGRLDLLAVLRATDAALLDQFGHFYLPGRKTSTLRRNALLALAASGDERAVGPVTGYLNNPDPVLREQAAWTLGRLGGPEDPGADHPGAAS